MTVRMHSLEHVAEQCLPPQWTDSVRWLKRRLSRGELHGSQFGRGAWMMSDADIEFMVAKHRNVAVTPEPATDADTATVSFIDGLSDRSRSRMRRRSA